MKKRFLIPLFLLIPTLAIGAGIWTYSQLTTPASADKMYIIDVSDTTDGANGTGKYIELTDVHDLIDTESEFEARAFEVIIPSEVNGAINWDAIENISTNNINWSNFEAPLANVNWTSLYINNSNVNWDDMSIPNDSINWDDVALPFETKVAFEDPTADDDFIFDEMKGNATATGIYCKTLVGTVDLDVQIAGADINGTDITCNTTGVWDTSLGGDTALNDGEEVKLAITSVASSPTFLFLKLVGEWVK